MQDWRGALNGFFDRAWQELGDFKTKRSGTPGLISLATVDADNRPEIRTVVFRRVNKALGTVETFTDTGTQKILEIRNNSYVTAMIWQPENGLQIRLRGNCSILTGDAVLAEWEQIPPRGQRNYGVTPAPGTIIGRPDAYERIPSPTRLACLTIKIEEMDVVHISKPYDIRAKFRRSNYWAGEWLSP